MVSLFDKCFLREVKKRWPSAHPTEQRICESCPVPVREWWFLLGKLRQHQTNGGRDVKTCTGTKLIVLLFVLHDSSIHPFSITLIKHSERKGSASLLIGLIYIHTFFLIPRTKASDKHEDASV